MNPSTNLCGGLTLILTLPQVRPPCMNNTTSKNYTHMLFCLYYIMQRGT